MQILEVKSLPTTVILSPEADLLGSVEGFVKVREYASVLKQSIDFQKTLRETRHWPWAGRRNSSSCKCRGKRLAFGYDQSIESDKFRRSGRPVGTTC